MVGNILCLMLTRGLSIVRWNNFPRVVDIKQMDNVGATLHTALFLAYIETEQTGETIDTLHLMKKVIFVSLADLVLSDINSGTKNYIKRADPEMLEKLNEQAYEYFLQGEAPDFLRQDFSQTLSRTDREKEELIFQAAKKYVGYFEASTSAKVYDAMYEVPLAEMEQSLDKFEEQLASFQILRGNKNYEKYLSHVFRLSFAMRWNQHQRVIPISVMSHKVIVAYVTYIIGMMGNNSGEENDINSMMYRAIYHDVPEVITGDIITPTKKAVPGFVELLEKVEKQMMDDYMFSYIPKEYKDFIEPYILRPFDGIEGTKVKYADILSALFEAKIESLKGNTLFDEIVQKLLKEVYKKDHPGVGFLIQEMSLSFEGNQDDIIPPVGDL